MRVGYGLFIYSIFLCSISYSGSRPYYIEEAAKRWSLDPDVLVALCYEESRCIPNRINKDDGTKYQKQLGIKSKSHGLFQIKLATARALGFGGSAKDLLDPEINSFYAAKLLRSLYDKYGTIDRALSAYNAKGWPVSSNKRYVARILNKLHAIKGRTRRDIATDTKFRHRERNILFKERKWRH